MGCCQNAIPDLGQYHLFIDPLKQRGAEFLFYLLELMAQR